MFNEQLIVQLLLITSLFFFSNSLNVLVTWYGAGFFLFSIGCIILHIDGGILAGFLWIIDLGVGLVFLLFILHFSGFVHHRMDVNDFSRYPRVITLIPIIIIVTLHPFAIPFSRNWNEELGLTWIFTISWYNYYELINSHIVSELHWLRELFFAQNGFEFFLINFAIFYGILASVATVFLVKLVVNVETESQISNLSSLFHLHNSFFIRNQEFIRQQNTSTGVRGWVKKKYNKNDF